MDWQLALFVTTLLFGYYLANVLENRRRNKKIQADNKSDNRRIVLINVKGSDQQLNIDSITNCLANPRVSVHTISRSTPNDETLKWSVILN